MIYLANILHLSGPDITHPAWDTMLVLRNIAILDVTARLKIWNEDDGTLVKWNQGTEDYCDVILKAGRTWAASFLPGNGFGDNPPHDFRGHGTIECIQTTPFGHYDATKDVMPFVLLSSRGWKYGVQSPTCNEIGRSVWRFPYAIPFFDDSQGATSAVWGMGISVQNFGDQRVGARLRYTVAQTYAETGKSWEIPFTVGPNCGLRFDLLNGNSAQSVPGLLSVGYTAGLNSEGHVDITSDVPAALYPSMIIANQDYSFTVGEEFA